MLVLFSWRYGCRLVWVSSSVVSRSWVVRLMSLRVCGRRVVGVVR